MIDQGEDVNIVNAVTAVVREADQAFNTLGGGSRHWVRDCFLPLLNKAGLIVQPAPAAVPEPQTTWGGEPITEAFIDEVIQRWDGIVAEAENEYEARVELCQQMIAARRLPLAAPAHAAVPEPEPQATGGGRDAVVDLFEHVTALYVVARQHPQESWVRQRLLAIVKDLDVVGERLSGGVWQAHSGAEPPPPSGEPEPRCVTVSEDLPGGGTRSRGVTAPARPTPDELEAAALRRVQPRDG